MIIAGVIAEYNPFHNGHDYQVRQLRSITGADFCIAAMSGDFVQRGVPALLDKYARSRMALSCDLDLVVELPVIYAAASAEWFARGAVSLLLSCGITHLGFGAECSSLSHLTQLAQLFSHEPEDYQHLLQAKCREGMSYPAARAAATAAYLDRMHALDPAGSSLTGEEAADILRQPNNILAIEYLKVLLTEAPHVIPVLIPRIGSGYHDPSVSGTYASATAIRQLLSVSGDPSAVVPAPVCRILKKNADLQRFLPVNSLSGPLAHLLAWPADSSDSDPILRRAGKLSDQFCDFSSFCQLVKTREQTLTHVQRRLLHQLLQISEERYSVSSADCYSGHTRYIRVLGFRKASAALLSYLSEHADLPVITRPADGLMQITAAYPKEADEALFSFETDIRAASFYNLLVRMQCGSSVRNDYSEPMVIL